MQLTFFPEEKYKKLDHTFGLFFEDLNHAADGGLYAEMLCNRDFEFSTVDQKQYHALTAWEVIGNAEVDVLTEEPPFSNNPHYARVTGQKYCGICNLGFGNGIAVKVGEAYRVAIWARSPMSACIQLQLSDAACKLCLSKEWKRYEAVLTPSHTNLEAKLFLTLVEKGTFEAAFVSLMPVDTWPGQANMLRRDIAEALAVMKPRFLRFPGGCLTHDGSLDPDARDGIYHWKHTIGPVENRPARRNSWGYHQTMGLGFYEYFLFCEDLGCEPVPVVNGGLDPHHRRFAQGEVLDRYIQDAVDLIEFAKGAADSPWGKVRADMGHPAPFKLHCLAVGNEEVHEEFHQNMEQFVKALRQKDASVALIGSAGPFVHGKPYEMGWDYARRNRLEYIDEHYYMNPEWFLANADHYAAYPADGPKVFLGEYASWGNQMKNALAEAAYMCGLQNAPSVAMACYAPMLCHTQYVCWKPNMLFFNNHQMFKTPNYYVQRMFMQHQGDHAIRLNATGNEPGKNLSQPVAGAIFFQGDAADVAIQNISLQTNEGKIHCDSLTLSDTQQNSLAEASGDFSLSFALTCKSGAKGCILSFGSRDTQNTYRWVIGGWQNTDSSLEHIVNGHGACLTQSNMTLEAGHTYLMTLEAKENLLTTTVDGEIMNQIAEQPLRVRPLYLAASIEDQTGDLILKAVNVQEHEVKVTLPYQGVHYRAETLCAEPMESNSLDKPDQIEPTLTDGELPSDGSYTFTKYSVTVLRLKQCLAHEHDEL